MPRVVLLATDPALDVRSLAEQLATWSGSRLDAVLVSLHPVTGTVAMRGSRAWETDTTWDAGRLQLVGRSYEQLPAMVEGAQPHSRQATERAATSELARRQVPAGAQALRSVVRRLRASAAARVPATRPARRAVAPSSRALRLRAEAEARARGDRLWEHVSGDDVVGQLVTGADAVAAVDRGAIRSAFHLARRHPHLVATNGVVPCLVELEARSQSSEASRTSSVGAAE